MALRDSLTFDLQVFRGQKWQQTHKMVLMDREYWLNRGVPIQPIVARAYPDRRGLPVYGVPAHGVVRL